MNNQVKERVGKICDVLKKHEKTEVYEVPSMKMLPCGYKVAQNIPAVDDSWQEFRRHDRVHGRDAHFWFSFSVDTPDCPEGQELILEMLTGQEGNGDAVNPQGLLYLNGEIACGLDINHREYPLQPNTHYEVLVYFYVGMITSYIDVFFDVKSVDLRIRKLYFDLIVPFESAACYPEDSYTAIRILKALELTVNRLDLRRIGNDDFYRSVEEAEDYLVHDFYEKQCGKSDVVVSYVGHTHIDVAWLWTLAQTREKVQRTFATMLHLMDRYPEFIFFSSQPQLFKYLKEEAPALYEKVKERVREGRFEVDGAMWLEADCNLTSGESLVRQIIHGKRFMKDEFGVDSKTLWLPDVFGYSAALPQILKKSGVGRFVTSKISWNEDNKMPYDTFVWQGIDGSEVFTYFLTAQDHQEKGPANFTTYVATVRPKMNLGTFERYQQKEYNDETIVTCGFGDGGGGTTFDMIEYERRLAYGIPGQPKTQFSHASDFLDRVEKRFYDSAKALHRMPKWVGELYLEFHRGTYTSMAKNKRNNRKSEYLLESAETLGVLGKEMKGLPYAKDTFYDNWEKVLLNQFHDIIPGSSIFEVYEDSDRDYAKIRAEVSAARDAVFAGLSGEGEKNAVLLYNPNGFEVNGYVRTDNGCAYVEKLPAFGVRYVPVEELQGDKAAESIEISTTEADTPFYHVVFDDNMQITSLYDKENGREVLTAGEKGNVLRVFENYPHQFDNWELFRYHQYKSWDVTEVVSKEAFRENGCAGIRTEYAYGESKIYQTVRFYEKDRRIDFETKADWHEDHQILKAFFTVDVRADQATYEIQYGNVQRPTHRNTSWDQAKFEVCAQKWIDLSEEGYGVSLLNDCKFGHAVAGNVMSISLIKTGTDPNPVADIGEHEFTYALLPHAGSYREGGTVKEAYLLNRPVECVPAALPEGAKEYALAHCDTENVILECAKEAEDEEGTVYRLYETWNRRTEVTVTFEKEAKEIWLTDLMEGKQKLLGSGKCVKIPVGGFEIVTLLVK